MCVNVCVCMCMRAKECVCVSVYVHESERVCVKIIIRRGGKPRVCTYSIPRKPVCL